MVVKLLPTLKHVINTPKSFTGLWMQPTWKWRTGFVFIFIYLIILCLFYFFLGSVLLMSINYDHLHSAANMRSERSRMREWCTSRFFFFEQLGWCPPGSWCPTQTSLLIIHAIHCLQSNKETNYINIKYNLRLFISSRLIYHLIWDFCF